MSIWCYQWWYSTHIFYNLFPDLDLVDLWINVKEEEKRIQEMKSKKKWGVPSNYFFKHFLRCDFWSQWFLFQKIKFDQNFTLLVSLMRSVWPVSRTIRSVYFHGVLFLVTWRSVHQLEKVHSELSFYSNFVLM